MMRTFAATLAELRENEATIMLESHKTVVVAALERALNETKRQERLLPPKIAVEVPRSSKVSEEQVQQVSFATWAALLGFAKSTPVRAIPFRPPAEEEWEVLADIQIECTTTRTATVLTVTL